MWILLDRTPSGKPKPLKLHLSNPGLQNLITAYDTAFVQVGERRLAGPSLVVCPDRMLEQWGVANVAALAAEDFEKLLALDADIVLLGTGSQLRFPPRVLSRCLSDARIGLEVMDLGAACRTYNILASEGRRVAAALILAD